MAKRIWIITGASSGLGKAIAREILNKGHYVVATFRNSDQVEAFNHDAGKNGKGVLADMSDFNSLESLVGDVIGNHGKVDVLVNNAGYGFAGAIEETSMAEARQIFEVNFFGAMKLTQLVLPHMRKQKSGRIIQISSHGGFMAFPGFGMYNASKFALEGMSEALAQEVAPLGIYVSIVEPGPFRTGFAGNGFQMAKSEITDYADSAGLFRTKIKAVDGKQEGDPEKAAAIIFELSQWDEPPLRLPLGKIAIGTLERKLASVKDDLESHRVLSESAVFE